MLSSLMMTLCVVLAHSADPPAWFTATSPTATGPATTPLTRYVVIWPEHDDSASRENPRHAADPQDWHKPPLDTMTATRSAEPTPPRPTVTPQSCIEPHVVDVWCLEETYR